MFFDLRTGAHFDGKNEPVIFSAESWREIAFEAVPWVWRWGMRPTTTYDLAGTDFMLAYYTAAAARFP
jgi:hypothetical protein